MKNFKNLSRRLLAVLVALLLCVGTLPVSAFAEEAEEVPEISDISDVPVAGDDTPSDDSPAPDDGGSDAPAAKAPEHSDRVPDDADVRQDDQTETDEETGVTTSTSSSTATYEGTSANGGQVAGEETTSNTVVTDENGNVLENSSTSNLSESTTNPTVTNPDGSTTASGSSHTEGQGDKTVTSTEVTPDPENPDAPVQPDAEEIGDAAADASSNKELGEYQPVPGQDGEPAGSALPSEVVSDKSDEWLGEDGIKVSMTPNGTGTAKIEANVGDWEKTLRDKIDTPPAGYTKYTLTEDDQIEAPTDAQVWKNGDSIVVVTPVYEEDGKTLKGYTTKTYLTQEGDRTDLDDVVTLVPDTAVSDAPVREDGENGEQDNRTTAYTFDVPSRPESGTATDASGTTTTTSVTELLSEERYVRNEDGTYRLAAEGEEGVQVVVGYKVDMVVTDAEGNQTVSSRSDWGVQNTIVTTPIRTGNSAQWTVVTDYYTVPVTRAVTTDNWTLEVENTSGGKVCQVWGQMGTVKDDGTVQNANGLQADLSKTPTGNLKVDFGNDLRTTTNDASGKKDPGAKPAGNGDYYYKGESGLQSALLVTSDRYLNTGVRQYVIYDKDGTPHFAYCADLSVTPAAGTTYGKLDASTSGYWSDDAATNKGIAEHVQAIALNGYWGTQSGTGSLDAVKQMLRAEKDTLGLSDKQIDSLTDGIALTATQAAIWSYATSDYKLSNIENPFGKYVYGYSGSTAGSFLTESQKSAIKNGHLTQDELDVGLVLYNYLRKLSQPSYKAPELDENSITGTSITVKNVVLNDNGEPAKVVVTDKEKEDPENVRYKYNTDVSFVLETQPSQLNDDLLVSIKDASGNPIGTWRLAGTGSETRVRYDEATKTYTIADVVLEEGVKITLNLHGSQLLEKSAYVIVAQDEQGKGDSSLSQTFVTAEDKTKNVNLTVDLTFNVREPVATLGGTTTTENLEKTDTYSKTLDMETAWDTYEYESVTTSVSGFAYYSDSIWSSTTPAEPEIPEIPEDPEDPEDPETPGTTPGGPGTPGTPETTVTEEPAPLSEIAEEPVPLAELSDDLEIPDEATPLAEVPAEEEELEIPDEEVPLADVPATGDISSVWSVLLAASAAGLLLLTRKKAEEAEG